MWPWPFPTEHVLLGTRRLCGQRSAKFQEAAADSDCRLVSTLSFVLMQALPSPSLKACCSQHCHKEETLEKKRMGLDQIIEFFVATDLNGESLSLFSWQCLCAG